MDKTKFIVTMTKIKTYSYASVLTLKIIQTSAIENNY